MLLYLVYEDSIHYLHGLLDFCKHGYELMERLSAHCLLFSVFYCFCFHFRISQQSIIQCFYELFALYNPIENFYQTLILKYILAVIPYSYQSLKGLLLQSVATCSSGIERPVLSASCTPQNTIMLYELLLGNEK